MHMAVYIYIHYNTVKIVKKKNAELLKMFNNRELVKYIILHSN